MKKILLLSVGLTYFFTFSAAAMERFDIVTTEELSELLKQRAAGETDFLLVNALDELIFDSSSIPGSINVPWSKVDSLNHRLGADKDEPIITY